MKVTTFFDKLTRNVPNEGAGASPTPDEAPPAQAGDPAGTSPMDYSWMGDYAKDGTPDFDGFKAHYQDLIADQAARSESEPQVPEAYDFALPDDFDPGVELPEGVKITLDADNPLFAELGAVLKEHKVPQSVASELPKLLARYEAQRTAEMHAEAEKVDEERRREYETLGATEAVRGARVQSVARALETRLPKEQADALKDAITSAAGVKALEAILGPRGVGNPPTTPKPGLADDPKMFGMDRLLAARSQ